LPAFAPLSVIPVAVTVLFVPTAGSANVAAAAAHVTPAGFPDSAQLVIVAAVVPSNTLFAAVTDAVTDATVIEAVVVAVVDVSV